MHCTLYTTPQPISQTLLLISSRVWFKITTEYRMSEGQHTLRYHRRIAKLLHKNHSQLLDYPSFILLL